MPIKRNRLSTRCGRPGMRLRLRTRLGAAVLTTVLLLNGCDLEPVVPDRTTPLVHQPGRQQLSEVLLDIDLVAGTVSHSIFTPATAASLNVTSGTSTGAAFGPLAARVNLNDTHLQAGESNLFPPKGPGDKVVTINLAAKRRLMNVRVENPKVTNCTWRKIETLKPIPANLGPGDNFGVVVSITVPPGTNRISVRFNVTGEIP